MASEHGTDAKALGEIANEESPLELRRDGSVKSTIANCILLLKNAPSLLFRFNVISRKVEISGAWWGNPDARPFSDTDFNYLSIYLEGAGSFSDVKVQKAIDVLAHEKSYNPVTEVLDNLHGDGGHYIENLLPRYLGAEKSDYTTAVMRLTMLGAIERAYHPGTKFDTLLCLVDDQQGGGKSTFARLLAINDSWFTDGINRLDDGKAQEKIQGKWIVEFSELLAVANARTVESIKSFLSQNIDNYRGAYCRYAEDRPRSCVFIGTSNNLDFLPDDKTGNRRFLPVRCHKDLAVKHPLEDEQETRSYILKAWGEAMDIYRSGDYSLILPHELEGELLRIQADFQPEDPWIGIMQDWLDQCGEESVCTLMLWETALQMDRPAKRYDLKRIAEIMDLKIEGWTRHPAAGNQVRFHRYGPQRAWDRCQPTVNQLVNEKENFEKIPFD